MKIKDFEQAMPKGVVVDQFKCKSGEVIWCLAHQIEKNEPIVYDKEGLAYGHDKEQHDVEPFLCFVHGSYSVLKGHAFNIRLPELDLKFE